MERIVFETVIREFWAYLGLGEPEFGLDDEIVLAVDDFDVVLRRAEDDGTMIVEGRVGWLSDNEPVQRFELEKLLKTNFALSAARDTVTILDTSSGTGSEILVRGYYPTAKRDFDTFSDLVSDVISSGETLRAILEGSAGGTPRVIVKSGAVQTSESELLILKP